MRSWSSPDREEGIEQGARRRESLGRTEGIFFNTEGRRWGKGAPRTEDTEKIDWEGGSEQAEGVGEGEKRDAWRGIFWRKPGLPRVRKEERRWSAGGLELVEEKIGVYLGVDETGSRSC